MNIVLWILQVLLALHTVMGAVWKFFNSEQAVPTLRAIPHGIWMGLSVVELLCAAALIAPVASKSLGLAVPMGAGVIAAEMLIFSAFHLYAGAEGGYGPMMYWLVVAAVCAFIAYGRLMLSPFQA